MDTTKNATELDTAENTKPEAQPEGEAHEAQAQEEAEEAQPQSKESDESNATPLDKLQQDLKHWKKRAREFEAKAAKLQGSLGEQDKVELRLRELEAENTRIRADFARMAIAAEHGLSKQDAELFLHGDEEQMKAQAEALSKRVSTLVEDPNQGRGKPGGGKQAARSFAQSILDGLG